MTPDTAHQAYFEQQPNGNHDLPSRRTLELFGEIERRFEEKLDAKVSFSTFTWVLGILMVVVLGLLGIIWSRVEGIYTETTQTGKVLSNLQGILQGADITRE